ncbi:MAG TPA: acetolactate synthase small subunit [Candidatus Marinimicrobia bacterium]|nr:acetolactate synthase small subunit [Candidatus Neomarinimicrobiota bacterium]
MIEKHTIIVTVTNRVGILARITGLLAQRGYNIESAIAAPTEEKDIYKIILVVKETSENIEQITKQLNKLIDTIKVTDISHKDNYIVREYIILKVGLTPRTRAEVLDLMRVFGAKPIDLSADHLIMELAGHVRKIDRFIELLKPFGIKEYVRSGEFAMTEYN